MMIEGAIRNLDYMLNYRIHDTTTDQWEALKLGIEALKRELEHRKIDNSPCAGPLPGETQE